MTEVINNLTPAERSLMYNALLAFKELAALPQFAYDMPTTIYSAFAAYTESHTKELMLKLFGDTHIDELEFLQHFKQYMAERKTESLITAAEGR